MLPNALLWQKIINKNSKRYSGNGVCQNGAPVVEFCLAVRGVAGTRVCRLPNHDARDVFGSDGASRFVRVLISGIGTN